MRSPPKITKSAAVGRGRPREFNREEALRQAMELFWVGGFQGTSISDLSKATGLSAPRLYAAFDSKEELFREAIALYVTTEAGGSWQALEDASCAKLAVRALLVETVKLLTHKESPRGCLLVLGDKGIAPVLDSVRAELRFQRNLKRVELTTRIRRAIDLGEISCTTDAEALAASVFIFMSGLSIETADGASDEQLFAAIDDFMARWPIETTG